MKGVVAILSLVGVVSAYAQGPQAAPPPAGPPATETVAPGIPGVVAAGAKVVVVKDGFRSTEGAITMPDGTMLFTEPGASRVHKIDKDGNITVFIEGTKRANGLAWDSKGRLIATGATTVDVIYPKGSEKVLAEMPTRPNDVVVDKKDGVYFTLPSNKPPVVYYIAAGGQPVIVGEAPSPHGLTLSPDEKTLYVGDSSGPYLVAFDVQADGKLTNRRNFGPRYSGITGDESHADGVAIDSEGRVYVGIGPGVQVFDKTGKALGLIPTSQRPQNLAFGGPDKKTLYLNGGTALFKLQMIAQGYKGRPK
jgi:gluconolactonase